MEKIVLILAVLFSSVNYLSAQSSSYYDYDDSEGYDNPAVYNVENEVYDSYEVRIQRFHRPRVKTTVYFDGLFTVSAGTAIVTVAATPEFWHPLYYSWYRPVVYERWHHNCASHHYYVYSYSPGYYGWREHYYVARPHYRDYYVVRPTYSVYRPYTYYHAPRPYYYAARPYYHLPPLQPSHLLLLRRILF